MPHTGQIVSKGAYPKLRGCKCVQLLGGKSDHINQSLKCTCPLTPNPTASNAPYEYIFNVP